MIIKNIFPFLGWTEAKILAPPTVSNADIKAVIYIVRLSDFLFFIDDAKLVMDKQAIIVFATVRFIGQFIYGKCLNLR